MKKKIKELLDYLDEAEAKHFEESGRPKNHIFKKVIEVRAWIDSPSCPLVDDRKNA